MKHTVTVNVPVAITVEVGSAWDASSETGTTNVPTTARSVADWDDLKKLPSGTVLRTHLGSWAELWVDDCYVDEEFDYTLFYFGTDYVGNPDNNEADFPLTVFWTP
jgi:hypothetical protein